ncbi:MAG TPA: TonB-dependent receptor, partial [Bacteroidota bacterium]|nr:TonB-dependent receptor [Bacteroidota bacterium]
GVFGQFEWHPAEWTRIDAGLRYDQHLAPDVPLQTQWSPRIKWNFLIDEANSAYICYDRIFLPTNIEGLRTIASNAATASTPTLPEKDNLYEVAYLRTFDFGLKAKVAYYYKLSTPGVDDETIGSSAIKTPVNIDTVRVQGIEIGLTFSDPSTPFSGYVNTSLNHAYGTGNVYGGFTGLAGSDLNGTDLDHDQRLSIVGSINYQPADWYANLTAIYGSGLTNGAGIYPYGTGLFDFNTNNHTSPSTIFDIAGGYSFRLHGGTTLTPSLYVTNVLNHLHLIKGAYFSGASYEEPRNVVFKMALHI